MSSEGFTTSIKNIYVCRRADGTNGGSSIVLRVEKCCMAADAASIERYTHTVYDGAHSTRNPVPAFMKGESQLINTSGDPPRTKKHDEATCLVPRRETRMILSPSSSRCTFEGSPAWRLRRRVAWFGISKFFFSPTGGAPRPPHIKTRSIAATH